jgi:hypothetical protein
MNKALINETTCTRNHDDYNVATNEISSFMTVKSVFCDLPREHLNKDTSVVDQSMKQT